MLISFLYGSIIVSSRGFSVDQEERYDHEVALGHKELYLGHTCGGCLSSHETLSSLKRGRGERTPEGGRSKRGVHV